MQNRRNFLKLSATLPLTMSGSSLLGALSAMPARAMDTSGYRALVCVFLYGGMDCHDTVLPLDIDSYNSYAAIRSTLMDAYAASPGGSSRAREALLPLETTSASADGRQFALPPQMSALHGLFEQGQAAIVGNVGPLVMPADAFSVIDSSAKLPARLFSHNDQQSTWLSLAPEGAQLGWGGRFGDAAVAAGANMQDVFSQVSLSGNTVFLSGDTVSPFQIGAGGVPSIRLVEAAGNGLPASLEPLLQSHFKGQGAFYSNLLERDFASLSQVSLEANAKLAEALGLSPGFDTAFPASPLGGQLGAVAKTIAARASLGASRQVFFVGVGGFDTHSAQATTLPGLQQDISDSLVAFYAAMVEMGLGSDVTAFTASDFGRTLTANGDGTDHGWGAHHFVVGGAVQGGDIYGAIPPAELGHAQDAGNGRLIPSTSVQQFAAPLGAWYGLDETALAHALPGLEMFPQGMLSYI
jgi:uncharacterized protein (DUF1501 family)